MFKKFHAAYSMKINEDSNASVVHKKKNNESRMKTAVTGIDWIKIFYKLETAIFGRLFCIRNVCLHGTSIWKFSYSMQTSDDKIPTSDECWWLVVYVVQCFALYNRYYWGDDEIVFGLLSFSFDNNCSVVQNSNTITIWSFYASIYGRIGMVPWHMVHCSIRLALSTHTYVNETFAMIMNSIALTLF